MTKPFENAPKTKRTLELTDFQWNLVCFSVRHSLQLLRTEGKTGTGLNTSNGYSGLASQAANYGQKIYHEALAEVLTQLRGFG